MEKHVSQLPRLQAAIVTHVVPQAVVPQSRLVRRGDVARRLHVEAVTSVHEDYVGGLRHALEADVQGTAHLLHEDDGPLIRLAWEPVRQHLHWRE